MNQDILDWTDQVILRQSDDGFFRVLDQRDDPFDGTAFLLVALDARLASGPHYGVRHNDGSVSTRSTAP